MKRLCYFLLLTFFISCEEENLLEDVFLDNPYDLEVVDYVEVYNVRQLGCETIEIDLRVNLGNIPPTLNYSHFVIKTAPSQARKVNKAFTSDLKIIVPCGLEETFEITLYDDNTQLESLPSVFNYIP